MSRATLIRDAQAEYEEVSSWTCETCNTMTECEGPYCRACAAYWQDVRDGMFDHEYFE